MSEVSYFDDLVADISGKADAFVDDLISNANKVADMLEGMASGLSGFFDDVWPGDDIDRAINKWNNEIQPAIQEGVYKVATEVQKAVDSLAGNPIDLIDYSNSYADAKLKLYKTQSLSQMLLALGGGWSGDAYDAYSLVAVEQNSALLDLSKALEDGGKATNAAAQKILDLWRQLVREFATFGADIIEILASATDASKVLSFELPTILEAIAKVWNKIIAIADILAEFMVAQATEDALSWRILNNGSDGIPQNQWPRILESSSDTMNASGSWSVT